MLFILGKKLHRIVYIFLGSKQSFFASFINNSPYIKYTQIHLHTYKHIYILYILLLFLTDFIILHTRKYYDYIQYIYIFLSDDFFNF